MFDADRRKFFQHSGLGLAAAGAGLILRADARPTPMIANFDIVLERDASR